MYNKHIWKMRDLSLQYKELLVPYNTWCESFEKAFGIVVTKNGMWDDFGTKDRLFYMPLPHFLLLFD